MFSMIVEQHVRDGLLSQEEASRCSRDQLEFLIRCAAIGGPVDGACQACGALLPLLLLLWAAAGLARPWLAVRQP